MDSEDGKMGRIEERKFLCTNIMYSTVHSAGVPIGLVRHRVMTKFNVTLICSGWAKYHAVFVAHCTLVLGMVMVPECYTRYPIASLCSHMKKSSVPRNYS